MEQVKTVEEAAAAIQAEIDKLTSLANQLQGRLERIKERTAKQRAALEVLESLTDKPAIREAVSASTNRMGRGKLRELLLSSLKANPDGLRVSEACRLVGDACGKEINLKSADNALRALKEAGQVHSKDGVWLIVTSPRHRLGGLAGVSPSQPKQSGLSALERLQPIMGSDGNGR